MTKLLKNLNTIYYNQGQALYVHKIKHLHTMCKDPSLNPHSSPVRMLYKAKKFIYWYLYLSLFQFLCSSQ